VKEGAHMGSDLRSSIDLTSLDKMSLFHSSSCFSLGDV